MTSPAPRRQAPVLPGLAERIRRHADGRVEAELVLPRPHVRAVGGDHERQVAEHAHRPRQSLGLRPLLGGDPLQVRAIRRSRARAMRAASATAAASARASGAGQSHHGALVMRPRESRGTARSRRATTPSRRRTRRSAPRAASRARPRARGSDRTPRRSQRVLRARRIVAYSIRGDCAQRVELRLLGAVERVLAAECREVRRRRAS